MLSTSTVHLRMDESLTESLLVWVKGKAEEGDIKMGVCYRLPDQEDQVDEAPYKQIGAMPYSSISQVVGVEPFCY